MGKTVLVLFTTIGVIAGAYFGSFYATRTALAHGAHCGSGPYPACNTGYKGAIPRYWAMQKSDQTQPNGFSNGIRGGLSVSDVPMLDPATTSLSECETIPLFGGTSPGCDFIAHAVQVVNPGFTQFMTMGFTEGIMQSFGTPVIRTSPKVFTEIKSPCQGELFFERSTTSLQEFVGLRWSGTSGVCADGQTHQKWYYLRGSGYATYDIAFMGSSYGDFRAFSEHFDNSHMEPNGFQCFGRSATCGESPAHELKFYIRPNNTWYTWASTGTPTIIIDNLDDGGGYQYGYINPYRSFFSGGQW